MSKRNKPFYKKWWFVTIVALLVVGVIFYPSEEQRAQLENERNIKKEEAAEKDRLKEIEKAEAKAEAEAEKIAAKEEKEAKAEEEAKVKAEKAAMKEEEKAAAKAEKERLKELEEAEKAAAKEELKVKAEKAAMKEEVDESVKISRTEEIENIIVDIIDSDLKNVRVTSVTINKNAAKNDGSYIVLPYLVWDGKNRAPKTREWLETYGDHLAAKLADESDIGEVTVFWEVPFHKENENIAKYMYERKGDGMAKVGNWQSPILR